jgi:hypothetical protein
MLLATIAAALAQAPGNASPPSTWSAVEADVIVALSVRHPPSCADLHARIERADADAATVFVHIAERYDGLPWVGMLTAQCAVPLVGARQAVRGWLVDPANAGLADVVLLALPGLPSNDAKELLAHALTGPHHDLAALRSRAMPTLVSPVPTP